MLRSLSLVFTVALALSSCDTHTEAPTSIACASASDTWTLLGLRDDRIATISSIAVDPVDPNIVLAGTASNFSEGIPKEIYRSTDAGATWVRVYVESSGKSTSQIVYDPFDPNVVYAATDALVKSTDRGLTWAAAIKGIIVSTDTRVQQVAFDPATPGRLYLTTAGFSGGTFYRSDDDGTTWTEPAPACPDTRQGPYCALAAGGISLATTADGRIYVSTNFTGSVVTSDDGGETWAYAIEGESGAGGILNYLLADHSDPSIVYAGLEQNVSDVALLTETRDRGASWSRTADGLPFPMTVQGLIQNPIDGALFLSGGYLQSIGSVWRRGAGDTTWEDVGPDTPVVVFSGLAVSPSRGVLYGGGFGIWSRPLPGVTSTEAGPCD